MPSRVRSTSQFTPSTCQHNMGLLHTIPEHGLLSDWNDCCCSYTVQVCPKVHHLVGLQAAREAAARCGQQLVVDHRKASMGFCLAVGSATASTCCP
jgi:hypothetical protein